jgi:uncharacterized protein
MTSIFQQHGAFSWFELITPDTAGAKEFYAKLFGWEMKDEPMPEMIYTILSAGGQQVAGLMATPPEMQGMPPCWGVYVTVDDVDASVQLVEELGGQIKMPPTDIPDVGRFAIIQDPQGAVLSIMTYQNPQQG